MHLKLPADYVDPKTRAPLPDAILVITDADFRMRALNTVLQAAVYVSVEAYTAGGTPVSQGPLALSPAEILAQQPALLEACYTVIALRPDFAGSTPVIP